MINSLTTSFNGLLASIGAPSMGAIGEWTPALVILAKATVLLLAALTVTVVMQRTSAVSRHLVWLVSLGALLLIPALGVWSPLRLAVLPAGWSASPAQANAASTNAQQATTGSSTVSPTTWSDVRATSDGSDAGQPAGASSDKVSPPVAIESEGVVAPSGWTRVPLLLLGVWAAVAAILATWLLIGMLVVRRIVKRATPADAQWQAMLIDLADRMSLDDTPRLLTSTAVTMPFACGVRVPTIVLPADSAAWSSAQRTAVLLHELAHIKRRDLIGHTVGRFACAMYWFHPLVWTAAKRLRAESERACDDLALMCGARPSDYAEHLLEIVTRVRHHRTPPLALAMATRSEFEGRMLAILDPDLTRRGPSRAQSASLVGAVFALAFVIAIVSPVTSVAAESNPQGGVNQVAADGQRNDTTWSGMTDTASARARVAPVAAEAPVPPTGTPVPQADPVSVETPMTISLGGIVSTAMRAAAGATSSAAMGIAMRELNAAHLAVPALLRDSSERAVLLAQILRTEKSAELRRVAAWGLAPFGHDRVAVNALASALRSDASESVREMAAWALSSSDDRKTASAALLDAIRGDANADVRQSALWSLGEVADGDDINAMAAFAAVVSNRSSSNSAEMREMAAWAMGNMSPKRAPAPLLALLSDPDVNVRNTAAWALYNIEDETSLPAIERALRVETDRDVQRSMVRALAVMGEPAIAALKQLIDDKDADVRATAIRALAGSDSFGAWPMPRPRPRPFP